MVIIFHCQIFFFSRVQKNDIRFDLFGFFEPILFMTNGSKEKSQCCPLSRCSGTLFKRFCEKKLQAKEHQHMKIRPKLHRKLKYY